LAEADIILLNMKLSNSAFASISLLNSLAFYSPLADPALALPSVDVSVVVAEIVNILKLNSVAHSCCSFF
jgi:hypothetical protein